jgi:hypothetical protein
LVGGRCTIQYASRSPTRPAADADVLRQGVGHVDDQVQRQPHALGDPPRRQRGRRGVDRDELGGEGLGGEAVGADRAVRAVRAPVEQLVVGVGELALAAEGGDLA